MRALVTSLARTFAATAVLTASLIAAAQADPADFYRGKQIQLIVGYGPGGGYDVYARVLARHMGAHVPGEPNVVVQNMPGAGSLRAANYIANVAPRDGTAMAAIDRQLPLTAVMGGGASVQFDPRTLTWIGSLSSYEDDAFILWARKDGPAQSVGDLRKAGAPALTVGGIADGSTDNDVIVLLRDALRLNVKLIPGYPDGNSIALAVERREVDSRMAGVSSISAARPDWLTKDAIVTPVLGFGRTTRHPKFPDMPIVLELAPDARARSMVEIMQLPYRLSRPYISPPDMPADRAGALREAFMKTARSSAFLAEAERLKIDVSPLDGSAVTKLVAELADAPPEAMADVKAMLARR